MRSSRRRQWPRGEPLASVTGRQTSYHDETVEEAYASRAAYGAPDWQVEAWVSTYLAIARGELASTTGTVERLTGAPGVNLEELMRLG